jgi:hypothetical protein
MPVLLSNDPWMTADQDINTRSRYKAMPTWRPSSLILLVGIRENMLYQKSKNDGGVANFSVFSTAVSNKQHVLYITGNLRSQYG